MIDPKPNNAGQKANNGDPTPNNAGQKANNGDPMPNNAGQKTNNGDPTPNNAGQKANNGDPTPNNAGQKANNGDPTPNNAGQKANNGDPTPNNAGQKANNGDPTPNNAGQKANNEDPTPNNAGQKANNASNMAPNNAHNNSGPKTNNGDPTPNNASNKAPNNATSDKRPFFAYTQGNFWGGPNADYTTLAILACFPLTGMLGLDHAYLRSPLTAAIKTVLNIFSLGLWYFFDAAQVLTEGDKVRNIGYSMPIFGPTGLGAGIFVSEDDVNKNTNNTNSNNNSNNTNSNSNNSNDKKSNKNPSPLRFLVYATAALIPLPFGQDFFAAGDIWGGLAKLVTLFMPLLWIFGFAWGIYIVYRLFFQTEALITEGVPRFFPFTIFMDDFYCSRGILGPGRECSQPEPSSKGGLFNSIGQILRGLPIIGRVVDPIMNTAEVAAKTAKAVVEQSVKPSVQFATASVGAAKEVLNSVPQVAADVANQAKAFTDPAALQKLALNQRGGGNESKSLTPLIVLLVAGLASSGVLLAKVRNMVDLDLSKLSRTIRAPNVRGPTDVPPGRSL
jgi:hypothetical protein